MTQASPTKIETGGDDGIEEESELVWPSQDADDLSQSYLNSERAKYPPKPHSAVLFTWRGFLQKAHWVITYLLGSCATVSQFRRSPIQQHPEIAVETTTVEDRPLATSSYTAELSSLSDDGDEEKLLPEPGSDSNAASATGRYVSSASIQIAHEKPQRVNDFVVVTDEIVETEAAHQEDQFHECLTDNVPSHIEDETGEDIEHGDAQETETLYENQSQNESTEDNTTQIVESATVESTSVEEDNIIHEVKEGILVYEHQEEFSLTPDNFESIGDVSDDTIREHATLDAETEKEFDNVETELQVAQDELSKIVINETQQETLLVDEAGLKHSSEETQDADESKVQIQGEEITEVENVSEPAEDTHANENVIEHQDNTDEATVATEEEKQIEIVDSTGDEITSGEASGSEPQNVSEIPENAPAGTIVPVIAVTDTDTSGESSTLQDKKEGEMVESVLGTSVPIIAVTGVTTNDESSDKASDSVSTADEKTSKDDTGSSYSTSSMRRKKEDKLLKVDKAMKRIFKRKVKSNIKHIIKSKGMPSFDEHHEEGVVITPTVCRVNAEEKTNLTLKKTELSGSKSSLLGKLSAKEEEFVRLVALIGYEGYGKSMLMKRYADMASGRLVNVNELVETGIKRWHPFSRKDFFKFVHYIDLRDLPTDGEYTPHELLFQILIEDLTPEEAELGYRWLQIYKNSMLFIVDGVNNLEMFPEEVRKHVRFSDKASPQCIIYNLLTGNILPKAHVLISSSITNPSHLSEVLNPDKVYVLSGFDRNDIKAYLAKHPRVWKSLTDGGKENLMACSKVPLGMFYTCNALSDEQYHLDYLLGAITHYVRIALKGVEQLKSDKNEILRNLKKLSYQCSLRDDEVIYENDLSAVSLALDEIEKCRLFTEKYVGRNGTKDSVSWIRSFTFSHITVREYLSALYLGEADMDEFTKFEKENFGLARFDFQQKSMYGLLFSDENLEYSRDLVNVAHLQEKRDLLRSVLLERIEAKPPSFYLYSIIHESPDGIDDIVKEKFRTLSIVGEKVTSVSMFVLSSIADRVGTLDMLELRRCYPNDDTLSRFLSSKKHEGTKIKILNLRENPGILTCGAAVREICQKCSVEELDFSSCNFHGDVLAALPRILKDVELKVFNIGDNPDMSENSLHGVGEFIKKANAKCLGISNTDLNEPKLKKLGRSLKHFQLESLDISKNRDICLPEGIAIAGELAAECKIEDLNMSQCGLTGTHCKGFQEALTGHKLRKLAISALEPITLSAEDLDDLSLLLPCVTDELRIDNWDVSEENLDLFKEKVQKLGVANVKVYYGSNGKSITKVEMTSDI